MPTTGSVDTVRVATTQAARSFQLRVRKAFVVTAPGTAPLPSRAPLFV